MSGKTTADDVNGIMGEVHSRLVVLAQRHDIAGPAKEFIDACVRLDDMWSSYMLTTEGRPPVTSLKHAADDPHGIGLVKGTVVEEVYQALMDVLNCTNGMSKHLDAGVRDLALVLIAAGVALSDFYRKTLKPVASA